MKAFDNLSIARKILGESVGWIRFRRIDMHLVRLPAMSHLSLPPPSPEKPAISASHPPPPPPCAPAYATPLIPHPTGVIQHRCPAQHLSFASVLI